MANLKRCKDCGTEVSKRAETCPSCGRQRPGGGVSSAVVILTGLIGSAIAVWLITQASNAASMVTG
jgi:hypothetical protein